MQLAVTTETGEVFTLSSQRLYKVTVTDFPGVAEYQKPTVTSPTIAGRPHPWNTYFYGTEIFADQSSPHDTTLRWMKTRDGGYVRIVSPSSGIPVSRCAVEEVTGIFPYERPFLNDTWHILPSQFRYISPSSTKYRLPFVPYLWRPDYGQTPPAGGTKGLPDAVKFAGYPAGSPDYGRVILTEAWQWWQFALFQLEAPELSLADQKRGYGATMADAVCYTDYVAPPRFYNYVTNDGDNRSTPMQMNPVTCRGNVVYKVGGLVSLGGRPCIKILTFYAKAPPPQLPPQWRDYPGLFHRAMNSTILPEADYKGRKMWRDDPFHGLHGHDVIVPIMSNAKFDDSALVNIPDEFRGHLGYAYMPLDGLAYVQPDQAIPSLYWPPKA